MRALIIKVAGHPEDKLYFDPGPVECGRINDGVVFENGREGGWVIAYEDLLKMTELAKQARSEEE